jgi:hypothetical protein
MMPEKRNEMRDEMTGAELESELVSALKNFRLSVHAWSEAEFSRPRMANVKAPKTVWRMAAGWAMGCVLVLGVASGGAYEYERRVELKQEQARQAMLAEQQEAQRKLAEQAAAQSAEDEDALLAHVDSDVARQVPAALDPLAGLVDDGVSKSSKQ